MNRIEAAFRNKPIFMPYFPLGYPDLDTSIDVIEALAKHGADLIEVRLIVFRPACGWTCDSKGDTSGVGARNYSEEVFAGSGGIAQTWCGDSAGADGLL